MVSTAYPHGFTSHWPNYERYQTGIFATFDFKIGIEQNWYAPTDEDTCGFVIQEMKVFSYDGQPHNGITIGQAIDWDIPSDLPSENTSGFDSVYKLIYQRGVESDGQGCQPNDARFGGYALIGYFKNDSCSLERNKDPYGAYTASNLEYLWPASGFVPSELYQMMHDSGYIVSQDTTDLHTVMTFAADESINPGDTLHFYTMFSSIRSGTLNDLRWSTTKARQWFHENLSPSCACCQARGNVDGFCDFGCINVSDVTYLVAYLFLEGAAPNCINEANVDSDCTLSCVTVADLTFLVAYLFQNGATPVQCP